MTLVVYKKANVSTIYVSYSSEIYWNTDEEGEEKENAMREGKKKDR